MLYKHKHSFRIKIIYMIFMFCLLLSCFFIPNTSSSAVKTLKIAHRGYWEDGVYEENTTPAINKAYKLGFKAIEVDVFACNDGSIRVFHDPTTTKICGVKGYIWKNPHLKIKKTGTNIPTLSKICKTIKKNGNGPFFIHLKSYPTYGYSITNKMLRQVLKILDSEGMQNTVLMCNNIYVHKSLYKIMKKRYGTRTNSPYQTFLILGKNSNLDECIKFCKKYGLSTMVAKSAWKYVSVKKIHKNGLKIGMYWIKTKKIYKSKNKKIDYMFLDGIKVLR